METPLALPWAEPLEANQRIPTQPLWLRGQGPSLPTREPGGSVPRRCFCPLPHTSKGGDTSATSGPELWAHEGRANSGCAPAQI